MRFPSKRWIHLLMAVAILSAGSRLASAQFPWSTAKEKEPTEQRTGSIVWKTDLTAAFKAAKEQRKLVFLHFSGMNCPPCRKLEENVLSRNDVAVTLLSRYVPVLVVVEQSPELVERFQVKQWPTDVLLDFEGREVTRHVSPQNPQEFIKKISTTAAKHHAGQSMTIANARVAVATELPESSSAPIQQTAGEDRKPPRETPRAESKVIVNPHTREARVPVVVARRGDDKPVVQEEDGFSPPNKRRMPPIVRKQRTSKPEPVAVRSPLASTEENVEPQADLQSAPWRYGKGRNVHPVPAVETEVETESNTEELAVKSDAELKGAPTSDPGDVGSETPAAVKTVDDPDDLPAEQNKPEEANESDEPHSGDEKAAVEETMPAEGGAKEDSSPVLDETLAPRSRFAEAPQRDQMPEEPAPQPDSIKTEVKSAKPQSPEQEPAAEKSVEAPVAEEPATMDENAGVADGPKSRFSGDSEAVEPNSTESTEPEVQEPASESDPAKASPKTETAPPAVDPTTPESTAEVKSEKTTEVKTEEETEVAEGPAGAAAAQKADKTQEQPAIEEAADAEVSETQSTPEATPQPKQAAAKKPPKAKKAEEAVAPDANEGEAKKEDSRPRGLAKLTRTGKYVLDGQCCVTLMETGKAKKGTPKIGAIHRGRVYLFSSIEARTKFMQNPDDYSPMLSGYDPVLFADSGELVDGTIVAQLKDNRIVAFATEESFQAFEADYHKNAEKSVYIQAVRTAMKETNGGRHLR